MEVESQVEIVFLDQLSGGSLYGFGSDSTLSKLEYTSRDTPSHWLLQG